MSNKQGMVSIIVPVYNAGPYLEDCLKSIMKQSYDNLEIILIDDCSKDDSVSICKQWMKKDNRVYLLQHDSNKGVSAARNTGLKAAKGKWVSFVDADDWIDMHFIEKLINNTDDSDIVACGYKKISKKKEEEFCLKEMGNLDREKFLFHTICDNVIGSYLCNKLFDKNLLMNIAFDTNLVIGEDLVFLIEYMLNCKSYTYVNECLYMYRMVDNSAMNKKDKGYGNNIKWQSALNAVEKVECILNNDTEYVKQCVSYRKIRSSLWVMFHMIKDGYYDSDMGKQIKQNIKVNLKAYYNLGYGSIIQNMAVIILAFSPKTLYFLGRVGQGIMQR